MYRKTNKESYSIRKKSFIYNMIWAILIAVLPFLIYIHLFFSKESKTISILSFEFSHTYDNNQTYMWFFLKCISIFILFLIWFLSSSKKWKYVLFLFLFIFFREIYTELKELFADTRKVDRSIFLGIFLLVCVLVTFLDVIVFKDYRKNRIKISLLDFLSNDYKSIYGALSADVSSMLNKSSQKRLRIAYYLKDRVLFAFKRESTKINLQTHSLFHYIFTLVLIGSFLLWFLNRLIPAGTQQLDLGFIVLDTYGFNDINVLVWYLASKTMIIIPMLVWFITCSYWWRFAILSPITLYIFQLWEAFQDTNSIESWGNIRAFPIIFCVILLLFIISKFVKYKLAVVEMYEYLTTQIEVDLENLQVEDQWLKKKKLEYDLLKQQTVTLKNSKTYLSNLMNLKHSLEHKTSNLET